MELFPRTTIEGELTLPRLIVGTNWMLGFSHTSKAKDRLITETKDRKAIAEILEVFFQAGCDAVYGVRPISPHLDEAIRDAEDRTGRGCVKIGIPNFDLQAGEDAWRKTLDDYAAIGTSLCMPHQCTTDALVDRRDRTIRDIEWFTQEIRQRGMVPGLSTHMPEVPIYADEMDADVATYIQIYNAAGFLMQIEVDWVHRMIWQRRRPVICIKPLAAGRLHPFVGLAFTWATIRDIDMCCVGCYTPDEAREVIEMSMAQLQRRPAEVELQTTRSKASLQQSGK